MAISVRGKNVEVTPSLKEYVEKRLSKFFRYFNNEGEISAFLSVEKDAHNVEVTANVGGLTMRGQETTKDMYASVDMVMEKLEKQVEKYKTKLAKKYRHAEGFKGEYFSKALADEDTITETDKMQIVKTKKFSFKPMDVTEAIMQMNLTNHSFYVFTNAVTEEMNVVYRRNDGKYGLIEAE